MFQIDELIEEATGSTWCCRDSEKESRALVLLRQAARATARLHGEQRIQARVAVAWALQGLRDPSRRAWHYTCALQLMGE